MRPLDDGPYEIVAHLHRPQGQANPVSERFERRALQIAKAPFLIAVAVGSCQQKAVDLCLSPRG